jgi:hypothetical protein
MRAHTHYSRAMRQGHVLGIALIALAFAVSCKKEAPKGDLPPASDVAGSAAAKAPPANPHGGMAPANPHGDTPPANPHGGSGESMGMVAEKTAPRTLEKLPDGRYALGPFSVAAPADWTLKPSTSNMRVAIFDLPGKPDAAAELVVTHFGPNGAGSVQSNLDRWLDQIKQPDGKPSSDVAKIEQTKFADQIAVYLSVSGRYVAAAMPGATEAVDKGDQGMLAAIVQSPAGPYYFKLVGAKATVDANAAAFRKMLESMKVK